MVIKPRVRGFMCITTHPTGCDANVKRQIDVVKANGALENGPKKVWSLVLPPVMAWPHGSQQLLAVVRPPWVCSLKSPVRKNPARPAGITRQHFINTLTRKACMRKASMAMLSPMK